MIFVDAGFKPVLIMLSLLASALLGGWDLLTADRAMERAARRLGILCGR